MCLRIIFSELEIYVCLGWLTELQQDMAASSLFLGKIKTVRPQKAQLQGDEGAWETSLLISEVTAHVKTIALIVCNSWAQPKPFIHSFIQQRCAEFLFCAGHYSGHLGIVH